MEKENAISVIMPAYNVEKYVKKSLDSLFGQSFHNFELIFINDGSTDKTGDIVNEFKNKYKDKIYVINVENGGQSRARNIGLENAKGEYIVFLDSDDYIETDYLETLYLAAKENNSDMVLSGQRKVDIYGKTLDNISYPTHENPNFVLRRLNPHGKLYRKEYLDDYNIRFAEGKLYEDNPFNMMAMFLAKNMVVLPYIGHNQVVRENSTTMKKIDEKTLPYDAIEEAIECVLKNKDKVNDLAIFEYTVLSFFTYFIFQANKKHVYAKVKNRKSDIKVVMNICTYVQKILKKYFPQYWKNKHIGILKNRDLQISQRLGVQVFVFLNRIHLLKCFVRLYYIF